MQEKPPSRRVVPPVEVLSNPVVVWVQVPHERINDYYLFYVITSVGHLYNIHRLKKYRSGGGTVTPYWIARDRTWEQAKELFERRMAGLGIALPRDFFKEKRPPWA